MPTDPNYNPGNLLDRAAEKPGTMNDRHLVMRIGTGAPRLSRIRNKALPMSVGILICLNDITGLAIGNTRELARLPRRMSDCIKFAYDLWRLREAAYEGIEDKRHVCMPKPDWGNFPMCTMARCARTGRSGLCRTSRRRQRSGHFRRRYSKVR
jgi:hypothetical protein